MASIHINLQKNNDTVNSKIFVLVLRDDYCMDTFILDTINDVPDKLRTYQMHPYTYVYKFAYDKNKYNNCPNLYDLLRIPNYGSRYETETDFDNTGERTTLLDNELDIVKFDNDFHVCISKCADLHIKYPNEYDIFHTEYCC